MRETRGSKSLDLKKTQILRTKISRSSLNPLDLRETENLQPI